MVLNGTTASPLKSYLYYILRYGDFRPANPEKNLAHLSIQNLSDIISGRGHSTDGLLSGVYSSRKVQTSSFGERSLDLMYEIPHKTRLLRIAQNYVGKITEVSAEELKHMSYKQKNQTQAAIIGNNGYVTDAWCAHTVSYMCNQAGINIDGHKKAVKEFIDWAGKKGYYRPIKTNPINTLNYEYERKNRAAQIKSQFKNMKEGDLIVWKSDVVQSTQLGLKQACASHIGIFECVNEDGSISVIEGNANEYRTGKYERYVVTNVNEAKIGNQSIGDSQEINPRDGIIRKVYTAEELASGGYSGYINMQKIVR